jgi:uncharacterized protein involved in exopolysaccharide biosynthesis
MATKKIKTEEFVVEPYDGGVDYHSPAERQASRRQTYERMAIIWGQRRWLGKVLLYGLIVSFALAWLLPTEYDSTAQLMPPEQSGSALESLASMAGSGSRALAGLSSLIGAKASGDLYLGVLSSRTVQDDLITKFDLRRVYGKKRWEDARKKLDSRSDMSVDKKSEIIKITVTDRDRQRATAMASEYVDELNRVLATLNTTASHRERVFLEDRLSQVKQSLGDAERQFSQFASKNVALDVPAQGKAMLEASSQVEGQMIAAQTELEGLRQIYTDNNIRMRETQARVAELKRQLDKLRGSDSTSDITGSDASDSLGFPSIRKLPLLGVSYADLMRETKVQEAVFEALTQQYEMAKVNEAKELPVAKVLDPPDVPERKSFPPRAIITIVGGILALGLGIGWIIWKLRWESIDPQDLAKSFAARVALDVSHALPWTSRNGSVENSAIAWQPPADAAESNGNGRHDSARKTEP